MDPKMEEHYKEMELKMQILNHWRQKFIFFCGIVVSACALCGWLINLCLQHFEFLKQLTTNSTPEAILLMCILMIVVLIGSIGIVGSHERKKTMDLIKQERKLTESDLISIVDSHISWLILGGVKWLGFIALGVMIFLEDFNIIRPTLFLLLILYILLILVTSKYFDKFYKWYKRVFLPQTDKTIEFPNFNNVNCEVYVDNEQGMTRQKYTVTISKNKDNISNDTGDTSDDK